MRAWLAMIFFLFETDKISPHIWQMELCINQYLKVKKKDLKANLLILLT